VAPVYNADTHLGVCVCDDGRRPISHVEFAHMLKHTLAG
jgi:hypothetical protein